MVSAYPPRKVGVCAVDRAPGCPRGGPALVPGNPGRMLAFLETPGLIKDQDRERLAQMLHHIRAEGFADVCSVPPGTSHEMLDPLGRGLSNGFGDLPAVCPLNGTEPPAQRRPHAVLGLAARQMRHDPACNFAQSQCPFLYGLKGHVRGQWRPRLLQFQSAFLG